MTHQKCLEVASGLQHHKMFMNTESRDRTPLRQEILDLKNGFAFHFGGFNILIRGGSAVVVSSNRTYCKSVLWPGLMHIEELMRVMMAPDLRGDS